MLRCREMPGRSAERRAAVEDLSLDDMSLTRTKKGHQKQGKTRVTSTGQPELLEGTVLEVTQSELLEGRLGLYGREPFRPLSVMIRGGKRGKAGTQAKEALLVKKKTVGVSLGPQPSLCS